MLDGALWRPAPYRLRMPIIMCRTSGLVATPWRNPVGVKVCGFDDAARRLFTQHDISLLLWHALPAYAVRSRLSRFLRRQPAYTLVSPRTHNRHLLFKLENSSPTLPMSRAPHGL